MNIPAESRTDTRSATEDQWQFQPEEQQLWTMDEKPPSTFDPVHNTHLWIVCRAGELAGKTPDGTQVSALLDPRNTQYGDIFYNSMCQGVWDADMKITYNGPMIHVTTPVVPVHFEQPSYAHHFYDPDSGENYFHDSISTAYTEADAYFRESLRYWHARNLEQAGYYLGLALHFFGDVTQPMHANNFINAFNWEDVDSNGGFLFSLKHKHFEEYANGLLSADSSIIANPYNMWPNTKPQALFLEYGDDAGEYLKAAARFSKPWCAMIHQNMDNPDRKDWVQQLLFAAVQFMGQYLRAWETKATSDWNPAKDDPIKLVGPLGVIPYSSTSTYIYGVDDGAILKEHASEHWYDPEGLSNSPRPIGGMRTDPGSLVALFQATEHLFTISTVADGTNSDSASSESDHLFHKYYTGNNTWGPPSGGWGDLGPITATADTGTRACSLVGLVGYNPIDLFAISDTGHLLHSCWANSQWSIWEDLGGTDLGGGLVGPADFSEEMPVPNKNVSSLAVMTGCNPIDVFAISKDGHLLHILWDGKVWSAWQDLGPAGNASGVKLQAGSLAAVHGANSIDVFAITNDNHLAHKFWDGKTWSIWEDLGSPDNFGGLASSVVAAANINPIDVFGISGDGKLIHKAWNGTKWQPWLRY